jgi:hypothetical protein
MLLFTTNLKATRILRWFKEHVAISLVALRTYFFTKPKVASPIIPRHVLVTVFNIPGVHQAASKPWAVLATMATLARMEAPQALSETDVRALMREVAQKFNFQPTIADWLVDQGVRSLISRTW